MTKKATAKKKIGESGVGARPVLQFRVHEHLYEALRKSAAKKRLTISEDAAERLSESVGQQERFPGVEKIAMLVASTFWHFGQRANGFEGYDATDWMKDPGCYREAFAAAAEALLAGMPTDSPDERRLALAALSRRALPGDGT
ncbi:hypothetical protein QA649_19640 [Bradyrhizobium sp. CB1717]|uniref:hypothetical protein n=1 Tax=Bradyrhizobium sp. CB1717 TaxID=3039154 RepID=UPI0024B236A9|nr:hypothetical protein [Bradyrhizobium sp. CB1717]WFU28344.1 hypothetical protein QA649_19640 [Bradyrhizobium sp. CB1717]